MAEPHKCSHFRLDPGVYSRKKKEDKIFCSTSTLPENMREQPKATKLLYSPRRPGKTGGKSDENGKSQSLNTKQTKTTISDDSSSSSLSLFDGHEKRKSLQILQPSADGQKLLVGGKNSSQKTKPKNKKHRRSISLRQKQLTHFIKSSDEIDSEHSSSSEVENAATTSVVSKCDAPMSSDEAYALMVQERAPERYWELLAEERRKALEETLEENMKLYEIIENLKAENESLKEKANNTDYFATMYKITKDDVPPPAQNTSQES